MSCMIMKPCMWVGVVQYLCNLDGFDESLLYTRGAGTLEEDDQDRIDAVI